MVDNELLQAISKMMDEKLEPIKADIESLKRGQSRAQEDITEIRQDMLILKEDSEITRSGVNTLLKWAEEAQVQVQIPLFKKAE